MEVRFIGKRTPVERRKGVIYIDCESGCRKGKIYVVISIENDWYRIVDESGEDYLYPPTVFEIVGGSEADIDPTAPIFNLSPDGEDENKEQPGADLFDEACDLIDETGQGKDADYLEAMRLLREAAQIGNIAAMNNLGMLYYRGYGVEKDYAEALKWIRRGAAYGDETAYKNLALLYEKGHGVPVNRKIALDMYLALAENGVADAMTSVGRLYYYGIDGTPDYQEAFRWYSKATEENDLGAYDEIGWCYFKGHGVKQDYIKAMDYFHKAAMWGDAYAAIHIALLYYHGYGVKRNYGQALCWAKEAARQGLGLAMSDIAGLYEEGDGVTKDLGSAFVWYRRALSAGYKKAQEDMTRLKHSNKAFCSLSGKEIDDELCREINYHILPDWYILRSSTVEVQKDIFSEYPSITDWVKAWITCPNCPTSYLSKMECMVPCPCCGEGYVERGHIYDVCETCWWEDDPVQFDYPYLAGGANKMSLYQARKAYKRGIRYPYRHHRLVRFKQIKKAEKLLDKHGNED